MAEITVSKGDGNALFHLPEDAPVPRVGEFIHYHFNVPTSDEPRWASDAWAAENTLDRTVWRVTHVDHFIRRLSITDRRSDVWVTVKRVPAKSR